MSFAEIQREIEGLSHRELEALRAMVEDRLATVGVVEADNALSRYLGCARGMMEFKPGWQEPEPAEIWDAVRESADDASAGH